MSGPSVPASSPFSFSSNLSILSKRNDVLIVGLIMFILRSVRPQISDRFHQVLYEKMFDRELVSSNKQVCL